MPPLFQLAPTPAPAEQLQTSDAIDPPPAPAEQPQTSDAINPSPAPAHEAASEPESPAIAPSSPVPAPPRSMDDADHTMALAMIAFLTTVIFGSVLEFMRWLRRRKNRNRLAPEWAGSDTLYRMFQPSPDVELTTPARDIPPPPRSFAEAEKLAEDLQKILDDLRTRPSFSMYEPSDLTRSG